MPAGQYEPVSIGPIGLHWIVTHGLGPKLKGNRSERHRGSRMAAICRLNAIHTECSDCVDRQLAKRVHWCVHRFDFENCVEIGLGLTIRNSLLGREDNDFSSISQSMVFPSSPGKHSIDYAGSFVAKLKCEYKQVAT